MRLREWIPSTIHFQSYFLVFSLFSEELPFKIVTLTDEKSTLLKGKSVEKIMQTGCLGMEALVWEILWPKGGHNHASL